MAPSDALICDMYSRMMLVLATGGRMVDLDADKLDAIISVPDTLQGDFWDFCLRVMDHEVHKVAMWLGRDTEYTTLINYEDGWPGPLIRGPMTVNYDAAYDKDDMLTATPALPAALNTGLANEMRVYVGAVYSADATLTMDLGPNMPNGTYTVTAIWSPHASPAWQIDTDTITVTGGVGTWDFGSGPGWVHMVLAEPYDVPTTNVAPYAPLSLKADGVTSNQNASDEPTFTWVFSDPNSGDAQSAYQVLVDATLDALNANTGDLWDSTKVISGTASAAYAGAALSAGTTYYWKVRVWDDSGAANDQGPYCAAQSFRVATGNVAPNAPLSPLVDGDTNPGDVATLTPLLSWTFSDDNPGDTQSARRVLVSSTSLLLAADDGDLWDTGKAASGNWYITYAGDALSWEGTYFWKVKTWDAADAEGAYCAEQTFTIKAEVDPPPTPPLPPPLDPGTAIREHFRLGTGRTLEWLSPPFASSGIRATDRANPNDAGMALIVSLSVDEDSSEMVTRVYPQSAEGITLAYAEKNAPIGYTMSATGGYIEVDAGITAYGIIEAWQRYDDISMQQDDSYLIHPTMVADALVDRASEYLRAKGQPNYYYHLELLYYGVVRVGETIRVVYQGFSDAGRYINIDADLYINEMTVRVNKDGYRSIQLEAATIDAQRRTDAEIIASAIRGGRRTPRIVR